MGNTYMLGASSRVSHTPSHVNHGLPPGRLSLAAAALVAAVFVVVAVTGMAVRPPWVDELSVIYFVDDPGRLIELNAGTGHPLGFYFPVMAATWVGGTGLLWLRTVALLALPAAMVAACWLLVIDRRRWAQALLLLAPAVVGLRVVVAWGSDLRPYGGLTLAAVILATTLFQLQGVGSQPQRLWPLTLALMLMALTHLTGVVLAVAMAPAVWLTVRPPWPRVAAHAAAGSAVVVAAWWWGVQVPNASEVPDFAFADYLGWVGGGLSALPLMASALAVMWGLSLVGRPRHQSILFFDMPALIVLGVLWLASLATPVAKNYTLMPALALLAAGMLLRLGWSRIGYMAAVTVLGANLVLHMPRLHEERDAWGASTDLLATHAGEIDCPVWVWPNRDSLFHTRYMLDGVETVRWGTARCECADQWFIANHVETHSEATVIRALPDDAEVVARWPRAIVGRFPARTEAC